MSSEGNNGNGKCGTRAAYTVTITQDPFTLDTQIAYNAPSADVALNMLAQAARHLEARWRFDVAQHLARQGLQAQKDAALAASIMNGKR